MRINKNNAKSPLHACKLKEETHQVTEISARKKVKKKKKDPLFSSLQNEVACSKRKIGKGLAYM